ncbi:hypothetical protein FPOAC1_003070 [Fusarium poae]|uniref:hypothetical protein n=1 Tax=Fusarium poae TaxID=36050 RepID=UPI001CE8720A|nr:hypothetical protein FPOAC1_003070 [Fusarium poae]KAG8677059.1 hypothetical protein FPOAC1_003070 [Fusarium poae]
MVVLLHVPSQQYYIWIDRCPFTIEFTKPSDKEPLEGSDTASILDPVRTAYSGARKRLEEEKPEKKRDNDALFTAVASNTDLVMFCTNGWGMTMVWLSSG